MSWCRSSASRRPAGPSIVRPVVELADDVSSGTSLSLMRQAPVTSKLSSARPSGSMKRWHAGAASGCRGALPCAGACVSILPAFGRLDRVVERRDVRRRRGRRRRRGARPSPTCPAAPATCDPRPTSSVRMLPWPSRPRRESSGICTRRKLVAGDVRKAVVLGEPLVDERVVGVDQVEHAAILAHDAVEEQLRLA